MLAVEVPTHLSRSLVPSSSHKILCRLPLCWSYRCPPSAHSLGSSSSYKKIIAQTRSIESEFKNRGKMLLFILSVSVQSSLRMHPAEQGPLRGQKTAWLDGWEERQDRRATESSMPDPSSSRMAHDMSNNRRWISGIRCCDPCLKFLPEVDNPSICNLQKEIGVYHLSCCVCIRGTMFHLSLLISLA